MTVDEEGYREAREEQRARGRAAGTFQMEADTRAQVYPVLKEWIRERAPDSALTYDPYSSMAIETQIAGMLHGDEIVETAQAGDTIEIVLNDTCFYVESGGQVSDTGSISGPGWTVNVTATRRPVEGMAVHIGQVTAGTPTRTPRVGDAVTAVVDQERRWDIQRNHTATHLLHHALRDVLGSA